MEDLEKPGAVQGIKRNFEQKFDKSGGTIAGPVSIIGDQTHTGDVTVTGNTTNTGNLTVTGGSITVRSGGAEITLSTSSTSGQYGLKISSHNIISLPKQSRARAWRNGNQLIGTSAWTKIQLNAETFDEQGEFDSTTNYRFQPSEAGYYQVSAAFELLSFSVTSLFRIAIYKNGSVYAQKQSQSSINAQSIGTSLPDLVYLNGSTDYIELYIWQGSGVNKNVYGIQSVTYLSIHKSS